MFIANKGNPSSVKFYNKGNPCQGTFQIHWWKHQAGACSNAGTRHGPQKLSEHILSILDGGNEESIRT